MSETPVTGNDKFIVHSNGHIKRLDASTLNGDYAFNVTNGNISMKAVETDITTSSFKDSNKKPLIPSKPFIPVAVNRDGFGKLEMPTEANGLCGIINTGATGFTTRNITKSGVIKNQYNLDIPTKPSLYYYDSATSGWKAIECNAGNSYYVQHDSQGIKFAALNATTLYRHCFNLGIEPNILSLQYNKGKVNNVTVPSHQGNYCLRVDDKGDVSFGTGETQERLCVTFKLSAKSGMRPTLGEQLVITSGDESVEMDSTYRLKTNARFFVHATFNFLINDTSIFDSQEQAASILFKIGSDDTNIIDKQYVYRPENGVLSLHFAGISKALISETPHLCLQCDSIFNALGVNLSFCDPSYLGSITFIEV